MKFTDYELGISYKSVGEKLFTKVINPLLSCSKTYKRCVGFFSSSALDFIDEGVLSLARNGGHIFLATCPKLSEEDIIAIHEGYNKRSLLQQRFQEETRITLTEMKDKNAKMLYELVKEKILDVKVVIKKNGLYHDKLAVLEDFYGNKVAFVGSPNESRPGYHDNYEKVRVYKSWTDNEGRIEDETEEFMSIWDNSNEFLEVYDFMEAFEKNIVERVNYQRNDKDPNEPYTMRPYQKEAKLNWINNGNKGFFVMATGTGKTITSLYTVRDLLTNNKILTIIAVPYKHLVNQWYDDVIKYFPNADVVYIHGEAKDPVTKVYSDYIMSLHEYKPIIIITTITSFFIDRYITLYDKIKYDKLLIVDEAHNFINKIGDELSLKYKYKLGLSATPIFGNNTEKTKKLLEWFGGQVIDFPIEKAVGKYLVNYEYIPIFVYATVEDEMSFSKATTIMMSAIDQYTNRIIDEDKFTIGYRSRLRAIAMAYEKTEKLKDIFDRIADRDHTIIYCSDGKLFDNDDNEEMRHLEYVLSQINQSILYKKENLKASKFTATEDVKTRMELIDQFNEGFINYLVAIKCLDEGINIPSIKSALIMSSNDNYREFVQRRGRILRLYENKEIAHIYDVIVLPSLDNKSFAEIELRRFHEYAKISINKKENLLLLNEKMKEYKLSYEDIEFKNEYINGGDLYE